MNKTSYNKTFFRILFALFFLLFSMLLSNYVVFKNSISYVYEQINENNKVLFRNMVFSFDNCFKEINDIIFNMNNSSYTSVNPFVGRDIDYYDAHLVSMELLNQKSKVSYIEDIVIFFENSDFIISSNGTSDFKTLIKAKFNNTRYAVEFWKNFAVTRHYLQIIPSSEYSQTFTDKAPHDNVFKRKLVSVVGSNRGEKSRLNIVVFINEEALFKHINKMNMMNGTSLVVLDEKKNVIVSLGEAFETGDIDKIYYNKNDEAIIKYDRYQYYYIRSEYNDLVYINRIPDGLDNMFSTIKLSQIVMIGTIFFGSALALILAFFLYNPINKISKMLTVKSNENKRDKLEQISTSISMIREENDQFRKRMEEFDQDIKRSLFFKMIDDITYFSKLRTQFEEKFRIIFTSSRFMMVSIMLQPNSNELFSSKEFKIKFSPDIVTGYIEKATRDEFCHTTFFHMEGLNYIGLIGFCEQVKKNDILMQVRKMLDEINTMLGAACTVTVSISQLYTDIEDCRLAYKDIKMCMAYRGIRSREKILDVEDIKYNNSPYLPVECIEMLSNHIISGDNKKSEEIIWKIINKNVKSNVSYNKFTEVATTIFNCIVNTIRQQGYDKQEVIEMEKAYFEKTYGNEGYEAITDFILEVVRRTAGVLRQNTTGKLNKEYITQYINLHYSENLYLENMAEIMSTSPKYFSNYFKRTFGVNFIEYLTRLRITHAREVLTGTNIPIHKIAENCGFSSSDTFTNAFKKYCGVTPNEYRRRHVV